MNSFPYVTGIIATDDDGKIAYEDGRPILHGTNLEKLDRRILRNYIQEFIDPDTLVVIGSNTFEDMKGVFKNQRDDWMKSFNPPSAIKAMDWRFLVSSPTETVDYRLNHDGYHIENRYNYSSTDKEVTGTELTVKAFERAMVAQLEKIVVLGGRSVYRAFKGHYAHFVHVCSGKIATGDSSRIVKVFQPNVSSDADDFLIPFEFQEFTSVPLNNVLVKVTILDTRKGEIE